MTALFISASCTVSAGTPNPSSVIMPDQRAPRCSRCGFVDQDIGEAVFVSLMIKKQGDVFHQRKFFSRLFFFRFLDCHNDIFRCLPLIGSVEENTAFPGFLRRPQLFCQVFEGSRK